MNVNPPSESRPWRVGWIVFATTLFGVVSGLPALIYPMGRDQGNYAAAGMVWRQGGVVYRDVLSFKPPATAWLHGVAQMIFGTRPMTVRLLDLVWTSATVALLTWLAWLLFRRRDTAMVAGLTYSLGYWVLGYWHTAQADGWSNLPTVASVALVLLASDAWAAGRRGRAALGFVAAGVASAFAVLFKYTLGVIAIPMLLAMAMAASRHGPGVWWGLVGVVAGGAGTLSLTVFGLWWRGAGEILWRTNTELLPSYVAEAHVKRGFWYGVRRIGQHLTSPLQPMWRLVTAGAVGLLPSLARAWRASPAERWAIATVVTWWVLAYAALFGQARFYYYHFVPILPASALLLGVAATWLVDRLPSVRWSPQMAAYGLLGLAFVQWPTGWTKLQTVTSGRVGLANCDLQRELWGRWVERRCLVARYLRQTTRRDASVLVWGFDPMINVWSRRRPASRLIYHFPLALRTTDHPFWLRVLLEDLEASKPQVIVVGLGDAMPSMLGFRGDSEALMQTYPQLVSYVEGHYQRVDTVGRFRIWRRRGPDGELQ